MGKKHTSFTPVLIFYFIITLNPSYSGTIKQRVPSISTIYVALNAKGRPPR